MRGLCLEPGQTALNRDVKGGQVFNAPVYGVIFGYFASENVQNTRLVSAADSG